MIMSGTGPQQTAREVWANRINSSASSQRSSQLTSGLAAGFRRVRSNPVNQRESHLQLMEQRLQSQWADRQFSVVEHLDFAQFFSDCYGNDWRDMSRAIRGIDEQYRHSSVQESLTAGMSSDQFVNLMTTIIRFGVIEQAELAPMELAKIVNSNLRLGPTTTKVPLIRTIADVVDDGAAEYEPTLSVGIPTPNLVTLPNARKMKFSIAITREMLDVDSAVNGVIRQMIEGYGEAISLHMEKLLADLMFGLYDTTTAGANPFPYVLDGIQYHTFTTGAPWSNDLTGAGLDGTQVPFELLLKQIEKATDPYSGELIDYQRNAKIVVATEAAKQLAYDALGVVRLIRDTSSVGGSARQELDRAAGSSRFEVSAGDVVVGRHARPRLEAWLQTTAGGGENSTNAAIKAGTEWLYGDTMKAFAIGTQWARERTQRSGNDTPEYFSQEVVFQVKWMEKSTPAVLSPQHVIRCRATPAN